MMLVFAMISLLANAVIQIPRHESPQAHWKNDLGSSIRIKRLFVKESVRREGCERRNEEENSPE
jgi:hypothetical protein